MNFKRPTNFPEIGNTNNIGVDLNLNWFCYLQENIHQETRVNHMERNREKNSEIGKMKINLEFLILLNFSLVFPRQVIAMAFRH